MILRVLIILALIAGIYALAKLFKLLRDEKWKEREYNDAREDKKAMKGSGAGGELNPREPG